MMTRAEAIAQVSLFVSAQSYPQMSTTDIGSILDSFSRFTTWAAATTAYILLGDLSMGTAFGDRRTVTIEVSDQRYFVEDALAFKATERFAFNAFDLGNVNATASSRVTGSLIVGASAAT